MRLWHQFLIPHLDNKRLLSQHRECCALRGKGWGKKHSVVDYVFKYDIARLYQYHLEVMREMDIRNYNVDTYWYNRLYRGKNLEPASPFDVGIYVYLRNDRLLFFDTYLDAMQKGMKDVTIYPEHDLKYLKECLLNLQSKNAVLVGSDYPSIDEMLVNLDLIFVNE